MKKIRNKFIIALAIMLVAMAALTCPAMASDSGAVDLIRNGSISVTLLDNQNSSPVSGAEITLYRVAGAYTFGYQLSYVFTDDFKGCGMNLDNLRQDGLETHLATYASAQNLSGIASKKTDASGLVTFPDLETGLYLVLQTKTTNGYYAMDPFLVSVPMTIANEWVYDVDASPKVEVNTDTATTRLTVRKVWVSDGVAVPKSVTVALLRNNVTFKKVTLNASNDWTYTWEGLNNDYTWDIAELNVPKNYTVSYHENGSIVTITNTGKGGNPQEPTPDNPRRTDEFPLIQTGQLNWPIPVLAGFGILLLMFGFVLSKKKRHHD